MLIDTHSHLTDRKFDPDRQEVIKRALDSNVDRIIEIACEPEDWDKAAELSRQNAQIFFSLGIHPHNAKSATNELWKKLEMLAENPLCVAIGETGLDYHYKYSPEDTQIEAFKVQLGISRKLGKPVIIHSREAYHDLMKILEEDIASHGLLKGVVHCFSGTKVEAKKLIEMGLLLGIDGPVTYPSAAALKEVVEIFPLESMLLETDSPYLSPQKHRGKRNEPSFLPFIAARISEIKKVTEKTVEETTTKNAQKLFGLELLRREPKAP